MLLRPDADVRVGHWRFAGPIGVTICASEVNAFGEFLRARVRREYINIIEERHLFSLQLCWEEPPNDGWTPEMFSAIKESPLERLNDRLTRRIIRDLFCSLSFIEYEPELSPEGSAREPP